MTCVFSDVMSFLRGSENYVWCTTSVLGKGATGAVFQGVNKNTGEPVAVKTFNQLSHMRPPDVQLREFEVLRKVKHENVVKLLAIEEEREGRGRVIVMELCAGGSLFNLLDDPEHARGLPECEWLLVLAHVAAGMRHLRAHSLVHRDLKPGNIMKCLCDDGRAVYKLTDFGAARELLEDERFVSLYGTEEYLHPDMYERAVLRKPAARAFPPTVDLWSIGVTLYHVAAGQLPFRPHGGRRNKETMFYITTKKAPGVISGVQTSETGPIEWSRELPAHCALSAGLRRLATPLLAGLLEVDPARVWSFDRFFSEARLVTGARLVHVYHANRAASLEVFLQPDQTLVDLTAQLADQTGVAARDQLVLHGDRPLHTDLPPDTTAARFPDSSAEDPLLLVDLSDGDVTLPPDPEPPKFPAFPAAVSVESDAALAKTACAVGYDVKRRVEAACLASALGELCAERWGALQTARLSALEERAAAREARARALHEAARRAGGAERSSRTLAEAATLAGGARALRARGVRRARDAEDAAPPCPRRLRLAERAGTLAARLRDSWQHLVRDRATRALTYNDEQFHVLERITVAESGRRARALLQRAWSLGRARADHAADWHQGARAVQLQLDILERDAAAADRDLDALELQLREDPSPARPNTAPTRPAVPSSPRPPPVPLALHELSEDVSRVAGLAAHLARITS